MSTYAVDGAKLTAIADAIRLKRDLTTDMTLDDMALQIALIDGGGGGIPNLLDGVETHPGYITTAGKIAAPDPTNQERYTDYISYPADEKYLFAVVHEPVGRTYWAVAGTRNSGAWVKRISPGLIALSTTPPLTIDNDTGVMLYRIPPTDGANEIAFAWNSNGFDKIKIYKASDLAKYLIGG